MGKMGLSHASILSTMSEVELVGCVDPSSAAERSALSVGVRAPFFRSVTDLLGHQRSDAAFLCLPSVLNLPVARELVERSVHIFVEKPLANTLAAARDMLTLEQTRPDLRFGIGFMGAYVPTFATAREHLASKVIGRITSATARAQQSLVFDRQQQWPFKRGPAGGGAAIAIGSHAILQVNKLLGQVVAIESAKCAFTSGNEVEDSGRALLRLDGGAKVELLFDWSAEDRPQMSISLEVTGTEGTLRVSESWLEIGSEGGRAATHVSQLPNQAAFFLGGDGYAMEDAEFVGRCLRGGPSAVTWSDGLHVQEVIDAIYDSAQSGTRVELG